MVLRRFLKPGTMSLPASAIGPLVLRRTVLIGMRVFTPAEKSQKDGITMKDRMNFTFDNDTAERLRQLAFEKHASMSHVLTELIWKAPVTNAQIRGQLSFDMDKKPRRRKEKL